MSNLLTRKEIAELLNATPDQVRKNEVRWGIRHARCDLNCRAVRYRAVIVLPIFKAKGWFDKKFPRRKNKE